jgi:uncharacterized radical SAM superfamily Fe-S cluster-containing enzyme
MLGIAALAASFVIGAITLFFEHRRPERRLSNVGRLLLVVATLGFIAAVAKEIDDSKKEDLRTRRIAERTRKAARQFHEGDQNQGGFRS